jgi:hypothetical protein
MSSAKARSGTELGARTSRVLVVATATWASFGGPSSGTCRIEVEGEPFGPDVFPGEGNVVAGGAGAEHSVTLTNVTDPNLGAGTLRPRLQPAVRRHHLRPHHGLGGGAQLGLRRQQPACTRSGFDEEVAGSACLGLDEPREGYCTLRGLARSPTAERLAVTEADESSCGNVLVGPSQRRTGERAVPLLAHSVSRPRAGREDLPPQTDVNPPRGAFSRNTRRCRLGRRIGKQGGLAGGGERRLPYRLRTSRLKAATASLKAAAT